MQVIKFRGQKEDGIWKYGFCQFAPKASGAPGCVAYIVNLDENGCFQTHSVIPETVGQFTTRRDKDGKDIYAGDIIKKEVTRTPHTVYLNKVVSFENGMFLLGKSPLGWPAPECLEVIGNLHENPDLLEGESQ